MPEEKDITENWISKLVDEICEDYFSEKIFEKLRCHKLPSKKVVIEILEDLFKILFPAYYGKRELEPETVKFYVGDIINKANTLLVEEIKRAFCYWCPHDYGSSTCAKCDCESRAKKIVADFLRKIPEIRKLLQGDVQAAYDGDPAAKSFEEIIISYPGIFAIAVHRLSHELYIKNVPLIPRIMSEYAHSKTGIDIHPGAKIGRNFFMDHGTGIVIGETTEIGDNVKIYQGVTLGALSFPKDERGKIIKGIKRHPTIEDNVTIYAGATILGGNTRIGKNSVIGGNVWLTSSVDEGTKVVATHKIVKKTEKGTDEKGAENGKENG